MDPTDKSPAAGLTELVRAEQARLLYGGMPFTILGTVAVATLLGFILLPVVSEVRLGAWGAAILGILGWRASLWVRWRRREPGSDGHPVWMWWFRVSLAVSGLLWTLAAILVFPAGDVTLQAFFALVLASVVAAATNTLTADRFSALLLMVPTVAPTVVRLAAEPTPTAHHIAFVLTLYFGFAMAIVLRGEHRIVENVRLRAEAAAQAEQIRASTRSLHETATQLASIGANLVGACIYRLAFHPDGRMRCLYISPNVRELIGVTAEDFCARPDVIFDLIEPHALATVRQTMVEYLRTGDGSSIEVPVRHLDGRMRWIQFRSRLGARQPDGLQIRDGLATDVTAAKEAEADLRAVRQRLELALEAANTCTWDNDITGNHLILDPRWSVMIGGPPREIRSTQHEMVRLVHPDDRGEILRAVRRIMEPGHDSYRVEHRVRNNAGQWLWIESRGRVVERDASGRPIRVIGVNTDISLHKSTEQELERRIAERTAALAESERRHRTLLGNLRGLAYRCRSDVDWTMEFVSEGCQRVLGVAAEELTGGRVRLEALVHPDDLERVVAERRAAVEARRLCQVEYRLRHADGSWRWVWEQGCGIHGPDDSLLAFEGYVSDVTERRLLEQQTQRAQRLESIGTLAGGIAHDLNNALAPVVTGVGLLKLEYPAGGEILNTIEASAKRGAQMVQQLLAFARGADGERVPLDPIQLVREMEPIIRSSFPKNIELQSRLPAALPSLRGDRTQLHQVLLNLCVNARDAMPEGGVLTIEAGAVTLSEAEAASFGRSEARAGLHVVLRVDDTGIGVAPGISDRIFEPFFSTKGPEKGTGLGLSTVLGIVRGHGGFVHVSSRPGEGSTFSVYLPATADMPVSSDKGGETATVSGRGDYVLVVDDEEPVRRMAAKVLERLEFRPVLAGDGEEGLKRFDEFAGSIRLVITDLNMPRLDGLGFVRELRRRAPRLPVIIASGRLEAQTMREFRALDIVHTLSKPFAVDEFAEVLRAALEVGQTR